MRAPQRLDRAAVREQQVVRGASASASLVRPGACAPDPVAEPRDDPRLVVRDPVAHAVAETRRDDLGVLGERLDGVALGPAARVLERLRQVPVVERRRTGSIPFASSSSTSRS